MINKLPPYFLEGFPGKLWFGRFAKEITTEKFSEDNLKWVCRICHKYMRIHQSTINGFLVTCPTCDAPGTERTDEELSLFR